MSWGQYFDQTGGLVEGGGSFEAGNQFYQDNQGQVTSFDDGGYSDFGQQKRSVEDEAFGYKKMKTDYGAFNVGSEQSEQNVSADLDWSSLSQITSWDQLASAGNKQNTVRGGGAHGGRGGRGRGGARGGGYTGSTGGFGGKSWGDSGGSKQDSGQFIGSNMSNSSGGYGGFGGGRGNKRGSWDNQRGAGSGGQNRGGGGKKFDNRGGGNSFGGGNRGYGGGQKPNRGVGAGRGGAKKFGFQREDSATMPLVEKFERLGKFLKGDVMRVNSIQSIENACTTLSLGLKCQYTNDEFPRVNNRLIFSGCLCINGIFLNRAVGVNKKDLKHEVYNRALEILKTKTVKDINEFKDPGVDTVRMCIERILKRSQARFQEGVGVPTNQTLAEIVTKIQDSLDSVRQLQLGLGKLLAYLKGPQKMPDNPISKLEQAMMASKSGLRHIFQLNTVTDSEVPSYEGEFILEDTCIARACDGNKKTCKQDTYIAALEALTTKPVTELVIPVNKEEELSEEDEHEQNEAIVAGADRTDGESPPAVVKPSLREASLTERLKYLNCVLSACAFSEQVTYLINNCVHNSGLTSTCIYKRADINSNQCVACEFYIENYLIAVGNGITKFDCMTDAYNNAYNTLTTSSDDELMLNCRKMPPNETTSPYVLEVVVKGEKGANKESNIALMNHYGFQKADSSKNISDMVIVETSLWQQNRKTFAFAILQMSASMNGLLLQWSFTSVNPPKTNYKYETKPVSKHRCQLFLKGKKVSEHFGYGRNKTRNFAAADILFHLYDNNDIVKIVQLPDEQSWIPYSDIEQEALELTKAAKEAVPTSGDTGTADKFIVNAIQKRLDGFFPRNDCEELLIGPGLPDLERIAIRTYALSINVMMDQRQRGGKTYCAFYCQPDMQRVVAALKSQENDAKYGRFVLVPKLGLPKHSEIIKHSSIPQNTLK